MRRNMLCLGILLLVPSCALAQSTPRFEVFGGYSYLRANPGGLKGAHASGWEASLNWNWKNWLGVKADFDGHYCCDGQNEHNFLFGPQVTIRRNRADVFFHAMGGVSRGRATGFSETPAAWDFGGGLDLKLKRYPRLAFRLIQADYLGTHYTAKAQHHFRYSGGIVFHFGKR